MAAGLTVGLLVETAGKAVGYGEGLCEHGRINGQVTWHEAATVLKSDGSAKTHCRAESPRKTQLSYILVLPGADWISKVVKFLHSI